MGAFPVSVGTGSATSANSVTTKSFYGRRVPVKDYAGLEDSDDPAWTPSASSKRRGGGKPLATVAKRGRKKSAEVYVLSSDDDDSEDEVVSAHEDTPGWCH